MDTITLFLLGLLLGTMGVAGLMCLFSLIAAFFEWVVRPKDED